MPVRAPIQDPSDLTEKEFSRQIYDLCAQLSILRYHTFRSEKSPAGFPDETLVRDRVIFLEVKSQRGRMSAEQKKWARALLNGGAEFYCVRPRQLDDLAKVLACRGDPFSARGEVREVAARLREATRKEAEA